MVAQYLFFIKLTTLNHEEHEAHEEIKQVSYHLYKLNISPCYSCAEMVGKKGIKQYILILRPLLQTSEEIHSYLGAGFWLRKNEHKKLNRSTRKGQASCLGQFITVRRVAQRKYNYKPLKHSNYALCSPHVSQQFHIKQAARYHCRRRPCRQFTGLVNEAKRHRLSPLRG